MSNSHQVSESHTIMGMSKRIQVTVPDRLADDLQRWADHDGRPISNLAAYLLERAVSEAKKEGAEWAKQPSAKTDED